MGVNGPDYGAGTLIGQIKAAGKLDQLDTAGGSKKDGKVDKEALLKFRDELNSSNDPKDKKLLTEINGEVDKIKDDKSFRGLQWGDADVKVDLIHKADVHEQITTPPPPPPPPTGVPRVNVWGNTPH